MLYCYENLWSEEPGLSAKISPSEEVYTKLLGATLLGKSIVLNVFDHQWVKST